MNHQNTRGMKNRRYFFLLIIPVIFSALAGVVMLLWNAILPDVFQVSTITYWQALGLLILSRILIGGFRFGGRKGPPFAGPPPHIRERWMQLSEEEKQKLKEEWRRRCERRTS